MKLSTLLPVSFTLLPSLVAASAIPDVAPRHESLSKRGGEVNYLTNCERGNQYNAYDNYPASYVAWYSNVDNSQSGQRPDSLSSEYRNWDAGGDYLHWEGQEQDIYFPDSGVTVQTHIDGNAQSRGFGDYAGYAYRPADGKTFNCYKDDSRTLFRWDPPVPDGTAHSILCWSIYWCV
ncbi:hypothetical protein M407DRAFT_18271 [Tulasnella calospora MUT 4182]|uniref:Uncharacterized protein n=1 Tax=Tulasnella calospora MUT 4182 TaxID=1051891 RepID=A0A0C3QU17_9AGAM|nr:hypothetical protein M407DRAFT_18271 [Tulasnella calospora MUT 4182]